LLDVNVFVALLAPHHVHHHLVTEWFNAPNLQWGTCPFTEAGFLRIATAPRPGQITMKDASVLLEEMAHTPGYHYVPISTSWETLTRPFATKLYGTKQVTDAYLLGLAIQQNMVLATLDKGIVHLAGRQHRKYVLLLGDS